MQFQPLKKVGAPVSFKGLKGVYLIDTLIALAVLVLSAIFITMLPLGGYIQLGICGIAVFLFSEKLKKNRKKSKGDLHLPLKQKCRRTVCIRK